MNIFFRPIRKTIPKYFILLPLYIILMLRWGVEPQMWDSNGWNCIAYTFSISMSPDSQDVLNILFSVAPYLIFLYLFSQEYREDFIINYSYVFTRYQKKRNWFFKKAGQLLLIIAIQFILLFLGIWVLALCLGYVFPFSPDMLAMVILLYLTNVFTMYFLLLMENFLSLPLGGTKSFFFVMVAFILLLVLAIISCQTTAWPPIFFINPAAQSLYFLHSDAFYPDPYSSIGFQIPDFPVFYSLLYLVILIIVVMYVFLRLLNRKDLINMIGGDN